MAKQQLVSDLLLEDDLTINLSEVLLFNEADHDHHDHDQHDHDQNFPIPDEKYAEEFQFQEALMASLITSQMKTNSSSSSSPSFIIAENSKKQEPEMGSSLSAPSSSSSRCFCEICAEKKQTEEMFNNNNNNNKCAYSFCTDCIIKHISIRVQHNRFINSNTVSCPGFDCIDHVLELEACSSFLPKQVIEEWDEALCESAILGSDKFYCPFKDCSAMLIIDGEEEVIRQSECPICHRLFCARCYVPWHSGVDCEEFQRMNENERGREDLMVKELAKEKKWKRCPHCKYYVEKTEGCLHITCRCNFQFCYACGSEWTETHGACQTN